MVTKVNRIGNNCGTMTVDMEKNVLLVTKNGGMKHSLFAATLNHVTLFVSKLQIHLEFNKIILCYNYLLFIRPVSCLISNYEKRYSSLCDRVGR